MKKLICSLVVCFLIAFLFGCTERKKVDTSSSKVITSAPEKIETKSQLEPSSNVSTEPKVTDETEAHRDKSSNMIENFALICQYPELPTGCEMTSLTMLLNFYGVPADKCDISDNYLQKGEVGTVDFNVSFVGDPRDPNSYGCYAPVVVDAANTYLVAQGSSLTAKSIEVSHLDSLFDYIDQGMPVMVWGTQDCREGYYSVTWNVDGRALTWITPEHCMVLVGYDLENVFVADPMYGEIKSFDKYSFEASFEKLHRQAVIIS